MPGSRSGGSAAGDAYLPSGHAVANLSAGHPACGGTWTYIKSLGKHVGTVGESYVLTSHATQEFTYTKGQPSSIGVGWSNSGLTRTFSIQGTFSWSVSFGEEWATFGANKSVWYQTEFKFGEYECNIIGIVRYVDVVNGYAGGAIHKTPTAIPNAPAKLCVPQEAGSKAHSGNSSAVTWSKSLGIGAGLGLQATIETGFDTSAEVNYVFSANRLLCGWKDDPGGTPQQLVVHT